MKVYRVERSIFGELGSLKRGQTLNENDPRIVNNKRHVDDLVKRKLLTVSEADPAAKPAKGKARGGDDDSAKEA